jgi:hypothetical protein
LPTAAEIAHVLNKGSNLKELQEYYGKDYANRLY